MTVRSLAPWLWLVEFKTTARALDASSTPGDLALALKGHFFAVDVLRPTPSALEKVRALATRQGWSADGFTLGSLISPPWPDATFDCIALHDAFARTVRSRAEAVNVLTGLRRLLRPEGWLAVASPSPGFLRRSGTDGYAPAALSRLLSRAGFRDIRCLFVLPSLERPLTLIPDALDAIDAYEASSGERAWARRAAAHLGVRSALYTGYFMLACA
jgi:SAM-dependent methyltransferase